MLNSEFSEEIRSALFWDYYAASSGNPLPTFRDNVSVPSSRVKKSKEKRKQITACRET
jgi:hypothetical protein